MNGLSLIPAGEGLGSGGHLNKPIMTDRTGHTKGFLLLRQGRKIMNRQLSSANVKESRWGTLVIALCLIIACGLCSCTQKADTKDGESFFTDFEGIRVHYEIHGTGQEYVVFIHGWACDSNFWRFQVPVLEKHWRLILVDLPGHGKSDKPEISYTQDLLARAVNAVLTNVEAEHAVLVGHSMGVSVARQLIRKHRAVGKALVNVDGAFHRLPKEQVDLKRWMRRNAEFVQHFRGPGYKDFAGKFIDSLFVRETPAELRRQITSAMLSTPQHVAVSALEALGDPALWYEDAFGLQTLAIYARTSDLPPDNEQYLRQLFPNMQYEEWEGCGHFLFMEQPDRFNKALLAFLAKQA